MIQKKQYTYYIQTFGCQMNQSDSERMSMIMEEINFVPSQDIHKADVIILNTCSVRQKAEDRVKGLVRNLRSTIPNTSQIVLTGCIARRIWDETKNVQHSNQKNYSDRVIELQKTFPGVDFFIETKNFVKIRDYLSEKFKIPEIHTQNIKNLPQDYLSYTPKYKSTFQAYVPISTGCNHFCTFCIVPFSRGKEVCRPGTEIIREVFDLIKKGYKDITLLGQTVNRWIDPRFQNEYVYDEAQTKIDGLNSKPMSTLELKKWKRFFEIKLTEGNSQENNNIEFSISLLNLQMPRDFLQLIQVIDQIPGEWWYTWVSSHPNYLTNQLISYVAKSIKGLNKGFKLHHRPYLHFALQSGSDKILRKMNRRHTISEFIKKTKLIRSKIPEISMSTDIIVGFCGETDEDFEMTLKAQEECKFDMIYIAEYSPRKGTAAAMLKDDVPINVKSERKDKLNKLLKNIAEKYNQSFLNKYTKVLIFDSSQKGNCLIGRTLHNKEILIDNIKDKNLIGKIVDCKVIDYTSWALKGQIIS